MHPPKDGQVFDCATCTLWLDEDGILCCKAKDASSSIESIKESAKRAAELSKGETPCILLDLTDVRPVPKNARAFVMSETKKYRALALVSRSLIGSMVAKIFLSLASLEYPSKLFTDEEEARKWLKQYL